MTYWPFTPAVFITHVGRLPTIVLLVGREMLDLTHWSLFWVALAGLPVVMVWWLSPCGRGLLALLLGQVGVLYTLPYVFSDWRPYTRHVQWSADRLLVQAAPLALLLFVEAVDTRSCCLAHKILPFTGGRPDSAASHEMRTRVTLASHPSFTLGRVAATRAHAGSAGHDHR